MCVRFHDNFEVESLVQNPGSVVSFRHCVVHSEIRKHTILLIIDTWCFIFLLCSMQQGFFDKHTSVKS